MKNSWLIFVITASRGDLLLSDNNARGDDEIFARTAKVYYDFVRNHYYFLSRCLVANGRIDFDVNKKYILAEWHLHYRIVQFWDTENPPDDVTDLVKGWRDSVPEGCHILFNKGNARKFIAQHYDSVFVDAYDLCWHPAMKSDYFRLAYLYINGGLYVDADEKVLRNAPNVNFAEADFLIVFPLMRERDQNGGSKRVTIDELVKGPLAVNGPECYFANSPIFATKGNEIIKLALLKSTKDILDAKEKYKRLDIHTTTGPTNFTLAIAAHLIQAACSGRQPSDIKVIEWTRYAASMPLRYKGDERNWRNVKKPHDIS